MSLCIHAELECCEFETVIKWPVSGSTMSRMRETLCASSVAIWWGLRVTCFLSNWKGKKQYTEDSHTNCSYEFIKCNIFCVIVIVIFLFTKNILCTTHPVYPHIVGSALVTRSRCHRPSWHLCECVYHWSCHPGSTLKKGFTGALFLNLFLSMSFS